MEGLYLRRREVEDVSKDGRVPLVEVYLHTLRKEITEVMRDTEIEVIGNFYLIRIPVRRLSGSYLTSERNRCPNIGFHTKHSTKSIILSFV